MNPARTAFMAAHPHSVACTAPCVDSIAPERHPFRAYSSSVIPRTYDYYTILPSFPGVVKCLNLEKAVDVQKPE
jgi:hypothetical protein